MRGEGEVRCGGEGDLGCGTNWGTVAILLASVVIH